MGPENDEGAGDMSLSDDYVRYPHRRYGIDNDRYDWSILPRQDRPIVTVVIDAVAAVRIADVIVRQAHVTCALVILGAHSFLCSAMAPTAAS